MNKADKKNIKFPIICVSNACPGTEEFTGLLSDCEPEYIQGLFNCITKLGGGDCGLGNDCLNESDHDDDCKCAHDDCSGEYTASLFSGTLKQLRVALNSDSHSSHDLAENCEELCLGDFV